MSYYSINTNRVPSSVQQEFEQLVQDYDAIEKKIVHLALKHEITVILGEDKQGSKSLLLTKGHAENYSKEKGDWLSSYDSCQ